MKEITLSVMRNNPQTEPVMRQLLDIFERQNHIRVNLQILEWNTARQEVTQYALHQQGPDVSAMATTWVADLISMNALRPFMKNDLARIGQFEEFIKPSWGSTRLQGDENVWAVPWLVDTYVIHYRRDLLEQAGIDAKVAFSSLEKLDETVGRLSHVAGSIPIQLPYSYDRFCMMHTLAAWVWGAGGEFCTPDGRKVLFDQPEALAGIRQYFRLARHLPQSARERLSMPDCEDLFRRGEAATAFGTLTFRHVEESLSTQVQENWYAAPLPGPHFVGGVDLVVWKYSRFEELALELIQFLNRSEIVSQCARAMTTSPARLSALESANNNQDPLLLAVAESTRTGRTYFPVRLWGLMEERFVAALLNISHTLLQSPDLDLDATIRQAILPVARRLNITLSS